MAITEDILGTFGALKRWSFLKLYIGIRQGCFFSTLLFLLVVELLAIDLIFTKNIKRITKDHTEYKISQLDDDTTLFVQDDDH